MTDETVNNEGADPSNDIRKQTPGETTAQEVGDKGSDKDPAKVENSAKQGRNINPDAGSE